MKRIGFEVRFEVNLEILKSEERKRREKEGKKNFASDFHESPVFEPIGHLAFLNYRRWTRATMGNAFVKKSLHRRDPSFFPHR